MTRLRSASARSAASTSASLMGDSSRLSVALMASGTAAATSSSSEPKPSAASILSTSASDGPMCRAANSAGSVKRSEATGPIVSDRSCAGGRRGFSCNGEIRRLGAGDDGGRAQYGDTPDDLYRPRALAQEHGGHDDR